MPTNPDLAALSAAATQGRWTIWREQIKGRADAVRELIEQVEHTDPLADALVLLNAGGKCPAVTGCGPTSDANAAFIVVLVNEFRRGNLIQIDREGMRERVAKAMCRADPEVRMGDANGVVEQRVQLEWKHYLDAADAAIAAFMGGG